MKKIITDFISLFATGLTIPAIIKFTFNDFWVANSNTILTLIGLLIAIISAYYAYMSIKEGRKNDRFDDFKSIMQDKINEIKEDVNNKSFNFQKQLDDYKNFIKEEIIEIRENFNNENESKRLKINDISELLNQIEFKLNSHVQISGHEGVTQLLLETRKELYKLAAEVDEMSSKQDILNRLGKMESLINNNSNKLSTIVNNTTDS